MPVISYLLCTVRPDAAYPQRPDWTCLGKVVEDLEKQTVRDFELVIVDGLHGSREAPVASFPVKHAPPRQTLWTSNRKVAISTYRNTGLSLCEGELIVNLDDCCELPERYTEVFHYAWKRRGLCVSPVWPAQGDWRKPGMVDRPGIVYGFGSYPLEVALELNGYDEAYDGGQGLEDADWSHRLFKYGVRTLLVDFEQVPGCSQKFSIHQYGQSGHDPRVIDPARPIVKCCNPAFVVERRERDVMQANRAWLWKGQDGRQALEKLIGPCFMLNSNGTCAYHEGRTACPYHAEGFAVERDPLAARILDEPPVVGLRQLRKQNGLGG